MQHNRNDAHNPLPEVLPPIHHHLLLALMPVPILARRHHHVDRQRVVIMCDLGLRQAGALWRILAGIRLLPSLVHRMSQTRRLLRPLASLCPPSLSTPGMLERSRRRRKNINGRRTKEGSSRANMTVRPLDGPGRNPPAIYPTAHHSHKAFPPRSR